MSQLKKSLAHTFQASTSLLAAVDSLRNWRALVLLMGSIVAGAAVFAAGAAHATPEHNGLLYLAGLLAALVVFYGQHAVGIIVMQEAKGAPTPPLATALLMALATGHRLLAVLLLTLLMGLIGSGVLAMVLLAGKIHDIGPLLLSVLYPVVALIAGVAAMLIAAVLPLAAPAIWDGATTVQTFSRLIAIARGRVAHVMLMNLMLSLIILMVAAVVVTVLICGTTLASAMTKGIVGPDSLSFLNVTPMQGGSADQLVAALGVGVLWIAVWCLPLLVGLRGSCEVYRANIDGIEARTV